MPNYTKNLNLFKYDPSTDGSMPFDVQKALNDNWDILDSKAVNKSGDTMTGDLTIEDSDPYLNFKNRTTDSSVTPSTFQNLGTVFIRDKNEQVTGYLQNAMTTQNFVQTTIGARRRINGTEVTSSLALAVDGSGNILFAFPMCTTKPTTSSSARGNKVAVVTQNYLNGNSWYRVWSDGFIEQGGVAKPVANSTGTTITLLRTMTTANYTVMVSQGTYASGYGVGFSSRTTSSFKLHALSNASAVDSCWYVAGY